MFYKIVGVQNNKPEEPPTTVIIDHLDYDDSKKVIRKLMASFGKLVSQKDKIVFDKDAPEIRVGLGTGNYKVRSISRSAKGHQKSWQ